VQVGVVLAGGVGAFRGTGVEERFRTDFTSTGEVQTVERVEGDITEIATDIYFAEPYTFYGRAEPGVAFIVSPRLRLFAGAGFHYPGMTTFAVRATVFFPRRVS
jgi:hypothetical protein